jgi:leucyl aminopeptidase (aminopeptidase T)
LVDGALGLSVAPHGNLFVVLGLTIENGRIVAIDAIANRERLDRLDISTLPA